MMIQKSFRKSVLVTVSLLVFLALVWLVVADFGALTATSINTSGGNFDQGGGFLVYSTSGLITNGTSLTLNELPITPAAVEDDHILSLVNLSGFININLSILNKTGVLNVTNVTFTWVLNSNGSIMLNTTVSNLSSSDAAPFSHAASSWFNHSFNTNTLPDGVYNISVYLHNFTLDPTNAGTWPFNLSRAYGIAIDRTPPNVSVFHMSNVTNGSNITGGVIFFNVSINDSVTYSKFASIELQNNFNNGTTNIGFNVTLVRNFSIYHTALVLSTMTDGLYTIRVHANDTLDNVNSSVVNLSFTLDRAPPNITAFSMNITNGSNITGGVLAFNITINDSVTFATFTSIDLQNNFNNGTSNIGFNATSVRNFSVFHTALVLSTMSDGFYTVRVHANDTLGNINSSVVNLSFTLDRAPPNITAFSMNITNGSNITGGVLAFNITINDSVTFAAFTSIDLQNNFNNGTSNIGFNATSVRNFSVFHTALVLSTMSDGFYTVRVHANDTLGNINSSVVNLSFTLDRTPPNVSSASLVMGNLSGYGTESSPVGYNFSAGLSEGNLTLQIVVNDSVTAVQSVRFNVSNSSGPVLVFPLVNLTATHNSSNYTTGNTGISDQHQRGNFNISLLAEGWYNLTVIANDSLNNRNTTVRMAFVIDRSNPGVTVTCSPSNPTAGEKVTCTCTASDDYPGSGLAPGWGFPGSTSSESTTASGTGTFTSGTCRANDHAGNTKTATGSWTVTAASSGGSGSSGSGGGISTGTIGSFETKVWNSLFAGETATMTVRGSDEVGVTEVTFAVEETTYGAWVQVKKVDSLPSSVSSFEGKVYRNLDIQERNVAPVLKDNKATVKFKVEKSWLEQNQLSKNKVALFRFAAEKWNQLPTTVGQDDGTFIHYTAETPGFSYFVVGEAEEEVAAAPEAEEEAEEAAPPVVEEEAAPTPTEAAKGLSGGVIALIVIIVIVIAGIAVWYWKKK